MRAPLWVRLWMTCLLIPVNLASLFFLGAEQGLLVSSLAIGGILLNTPITIYDQGMSKLMTLPHILLWTPLIAVSIAILSKGSGNSSYDIYLWVLVATNAVSLFFDYPDFIKWLKGDRGIL